MMFLIKYRIKKVKILIDKLKNKSNRIKEMYNFEQVKADLTPLSFDTQEYFENFLESCSDGFYWDAIDYFCYVGIMYETGFKFDISDIMRFENNFNYDDYDWSKTTSNIKERFKKETGEQTNEILLKEISILENFLDEKCEIRQIYIEMLEEIGQYFFGDLHEEDNQNLWKGLKEHNIHIEKLKRELVKVPLPLTAYQNTNELHILDDLNHLIGLNQLKVDVKNMVNLIKVQNLRTQKGLNSVNMSNHLVFTGNPGTGKTTVARIIAKIYHSLGIVSKGHIVEVDRAGLVAGFIGQTAIKTEEAIQKAKGGVLFIDEAYSLVQDEGDTFGLEAIDTLLKRMEDYRNDLVVIVAGYGDEMERFILSNPGLKSRFNKFFHFEDYNAAELLEIFISLSKEHQYILEDLTVESLQNVFNKVCSERIVNFSNGRYVRNLFEKIVTNQAKRVILIENITEEDLVTIKLDDLLNLTH